MFIYIIENLIWFLNVPIHFSLFLTGIGQQLIKKNPRDPDCCYYLHCASYEYPVTPDPLNDRANAEDFNNFYKNKEGIQS